MTSNSNDTPIAPQEPGAPYIRMIRELATKAGCVVHHYPRHYIAVVEDLWPSDDDSSPIGERKPFMRAFPDTSRGHEAMYSALARRFPALATPTVECSVCREQKPYAEFDARFLGKNTRKLCQDCRESEQRAANERYERLEAKRQAKAKQTLLTLDAARSDLILRYPTHELRFRFAYTLEEMTAIANQIEKKRALASEWQAYCLSLGLNARDMQHIARLHSLISSYKERWNAMKQRFLALTPPYYGTLTRGKTPALNAQETTVLYDAQEGRCAYCHVELLPLSYRKLRTRMVHARDVPDWDGQGDEMALIAIDADRIAHIEHRIPVERGGSDDKSNLVLACRACNMRKGTRTDEEFMQMPHDAISQLGILPQDVLIAVEYERRGYARFVDETLNKQASALYHAATGEV